MQSIQESESLGVPVYLFIFSCLEYFDAMVKLNGFEFAFIISWSEVGWYKFRYNFKLRKLTHECSNANGGVCNFPKDTSHQIFTLAEIISYISNNFG